MPGKLALGLTTASEIRSLYEAAMKPGTTIADRYVIEALAGAGGMASVYKARDEREGRPVAIKLLRGRSARRDERFARESKLLCELRHPAIVRYFTTGITHDQERFLVMEWLEGEDLAARLSRDPLSIAETLALVARIAPALAFVHARRVVHRDIKPANIFLPKSSTAAAKLLDFGIARWGGADSTLTQPGARHGTPAYMSPEQARGVGYLNARSDVFSLGCVLYECLTGQAAFAAQDVMAVFCKIIVEEPPVVRDLVPNVPDLLATLIDRMLVKQPAKRPKCQEIAQLARHLQRSLSSATLQQRPISRTDYPAITESEQRIVHVVVAASSPELLRKSRAPARWLDWLREQMSPHLAETIQSRTLSHGESDEPGMLAPQPDRDFDALQELTRSGMTPASLAQGSDTSWTSTSQIDRVRRRLELIGARCNTLADGSMLAVLEDQFANSAITSATAVDQAANAARCALALAQALPDAQIALASGKAVAYERRLLGKVIDEAIALLKKRPQDDAPAPWRGGKIHTDFLTTVLLGQRFEVEGDRERGFLLRQERHDVARAQPSTVAPFVGRTREPKPATADRGPKPAERTFPEGVEGAFPELAEEGLKTRKPRWHPDNRLYTFKLRVEEASGWPFDRTREGRHLGRRRLRSMKGIAGDLANKIDDRSAKIGVVGLGYVGLPLAVEFADAGYSVVGIDVSKDKVRGINRGVSHVEDVPTESLKPLVKSKRLVAQDHYRGTGKCDVLFICVPTPLRKTKDPDISYIVSSVEEIAKEIRPGQLVVLESTTYPGTTEEVVRPRLEIGGRKVGHDLFLAFSPERVDPGNQTYQTHNTPKVVGGASPTCTEMATRLYRNVIEAVHPVSSTQTAEMIKLLENTFRAVNIALVNEIALMCEKLDLDVWEVIDGAATKPFGFMRFYPGPGIGGHCIPLDPHYLSWKLKTLNYSARFIDLASEINGNMPLVVVRKASELLNHKKRAVKGSDVLVLGVAYKRDTGDVRESPALDIIRLLEQRGAKVAYHDPYNPTLRIEGGRSYKRVPLTPARLAKADLVLLVTDHSEFDYASIARHSKCILDTRNAFGKVRVGRHKIVKL